MHVMTPRWVIIDHRWYLLAAIMDHINRTIVYIIYDIVTLQPRIINLKLQLVLVEWLALYFH